MVNMFMGGGDLIDSKKRAIYNGPAGYAAGRYYADLVYKHKVAPRESVSVMYPDIERGFIGGNYAMTGIGSWSYDPFVKALGAEAVGWSRLPIPAGGKDASFSGGWGFMISKATRRPKEAWTFVSHMASREAMLDVAQALTTLPHRKSVMDDPRIRNTYIGAMAAYAREASKFNPKNENNGPLFDGINVALQEILQNKKSPEQALNDAANAYNAKYTKP
jgi:ABC-type glycerol-3-phosphate transport system substrate-binding protein